MQTLTEEQKSLLIDGPIPTFAAIWIAVVGVIAYMFLPLMVGGLADDLGFNNTQLGFIGAAEAGGMGIANALAVFFVRRWNWRVIIFISGLAMVFTNLWSASVDTFALIFIARLVDGFAGGVLIALGVACQSDNKNANKVFGYFIATEMIFASIGFYLLPDIQADFGVDGIFYALALISITGTLMAFFHPAQGIDRKQHAENKGVGTTTVLFATVALMGALLFFMSQGGLWTFVERIGVASNLTASDIGLALTVSSAFGVIGALGANWTSQRIGQLNAFILVLVGEIICITMLYGSLELWRYFSSLCLFIMFWSMGLPLMLSQFNVLDRTGHLVVLLYAMGKLGYTLGPAIMGLLIFGADFFYVITLGLVLSIVGLAVFIGLSIKSSITSTIKSELA